MIHPALMLELSQAVTAARIRDAEQSRQGRHFETESASTVPSYARAQAGVSTSAQAVAPHRPLDTRASFVHTGARVRNTRPLALARGGGKHAARHH
jgi:hypothetical protein